MIGGRSSKVKTLPAPVTLHARATVITRIEALQSHHKSPSNHVRPPSSYKRPKREIVYVSSIIHASILNYCCTAFPRTQRETPFTARPVWFRAGGSVMTIPGAPKNSCARGPNSWQRPWFRNAVLKFWMLAVRAASHRFHFDLTLVCFSYWSRSCFLKSGSLLLNYK